MECVLKSQIILFTCISAIRILIYYYNLVKYTCSYETVEGMPIEIRCLSGTNNLFCQGFID